MSSLIDLATQNLPQIQPPCRLYLRFGMGRPQLSIVPHQEKEKNVIFLLDIPKGTDVEDLSRRVIAKLPDIKEFADKAYTVEGGFTDPGYILLWTETFRREITDQISAMRFDLWFDREEVEDRLQKNQSPEAIAQDFCKPFTTTDGKIMSIAPEDGAKLIRKEFGLDG